MALAHACCTTSTSSGWSRSSHAQSYVSSRARPVKSTPWRFRYSVVPSGRLIHTMCGIDSATSWNSSRPSQGAGVSPATPQALKVSIGSLSVKGGADVRAERPYLAGATTRDTQPAHYGCTSHNARTTNEEEGVKTARDVPKATVDQRATR